MRTLAVMTVVGLLMGCATRDPLLSGVASSKVTAGELELHTFFALPPFTDAPMPVYGVIHNQGTQADTLQRVSSPSSARVMIHGGGMAAITSLPVPAGDSLVLAPGLLHLMLEPPLPPLLRGDSVVVTLHFAAAGEVRLVVPVIDYAEVDLVR
jgi:copper(I)-binding protein